MTVSVRLLPFRNVNKKLLYFLAEKSANESAIRTIPARIPSVMTPEQIQADVDIILKTMGLSDDDCEELADRGAAPTPEATAASPPSSKLTSGSALSSKATDETVSAVSQSTED